MSLFYNAVDQVYGGGASGYSPSTINAINNNNAAYTANQSNINAITGRYDPFAQSGGFGAQTDYYSALGAAYGRATGGFGGTPGGAPSGGGGGGASVFDTGAAPYNDYGLGGETAPSSFGGRFTGADSGYIPGSIPW